MKLLFWMLFSGFFVFSIESKALIQKIEMKTDPKYVNASVELTNINNISFVSININQTIVYDRQLTGRIRFYKFENGNYEQFFITIQVDPCDFLKSMHSNMFLKRIYLKVKKFGDIPTRCPFDKRHYNVKNFRFDGKLLPSVFKDVQFRMDIEIFYDDVKPADVIFSWKIYATIF